MARRPSAPRVGSSSPISCRPNDLFLRHRVEALHSRFTECQFHIQNAAEFAWQQDDVFGRIASRYDLLCDVFSLGIHRLWKRRVARRIASEKWDTLLDGATGTGDIILRLLAHEETAGRTVIASDVSARMLAIAQRRLAAHSHTVQLRQLDAEAMSSIADGSVDAYSISLGLKICNRRRALNEALRILRPGGRLIVLQHSVARRCLTGHTLPKHVGLAARSWAGLPPGAMRRRTGICCSASASSRRRRLSLPRLRHGFDEVTFERQSRGPPSTQLASPAGNGRRRGQALPQRRGKRRSMVA